MLSNVGPPESPKQVPPVAVLFERTMYVFGRMALQAVELRVRLHPRVAAELLLALDALEAVADRLEPLRRCAAASGSGRASRAARAGRTSASSSDGPVEARRRPRRGRRTRGRRTADAASRWRDATRCWRSARSSRPGSARVLVAGERRARRQDVEVRHLREADPDVVAADAAVGRVVSAPSCVVDAPFRPTPNVQWPAVTTIGRLEQRAAAREPAARIVEPRVDRVGDVEQQLADVRVLAGVGRAVRDRADRRREGEDARSGRPRWTGASACREFSTLGARRPGHRPWGDAPSYPSFRRSARRRFSRSVTRRTTRNADRGRTVARLPSA